MIFHEIYGTYFYAVGRILKAGADHRLTGEEINSIIRATAFDESLLNIPYSLGEEHWQLLNEEGYPVVEHIQEIPLTTLQKQWINAISLDPRIGLFTDNPLYFPEVKPLFLKGDISVFDKYDDGDPYEDEEYIRNFRLILDAIKGNYPLKITLKNRHGRIYSREILPEYLEYSEKDDKFRMIGTGSKAGNTINLGRLLSCEKCEGKSEKLQQRNYPATRKVVFELKDYRNALERVLMHFAHFKKEAEKTGDKSYRITLYYHRDDETEVLIRILSFGPMIQVVKPETFINLIKERLSAQKSCGL